MLSKETLRAVLVASARVLAAAAPRGVLVNRFESDEDDDVTHEEDELAAKKTISTPLVSSSPGAHLSS